MASGEWSRQEPGIREAREVRQALAGARGELVAAQTGAKEADSALRRAIDAETATQANESAGRAARDQSAARASACERDLALAESLSSLESRWAVVKSEREDLERRGLAAARVAAQIEVFDAELLVQGEVLEPTRRAVSAREEEADAAATACAVALDGSPDIQHRRRRLDTDDRAITARLQALGEARRLASEVVALDAQLAAKAREQEGNLVALGACRGEVETAQGILARVEAGLEAMLKELDAARLVAQLAQERATLVDGAACPLCGSPDHPYRSDPRWADLDRTTTARVADLEGSVTDGKSAVKNAQGRMSDLVRTLAALAAQDEACLRALSEREGDRKERASALARALESLGIAEAGVLDAGEFTAVEERERLSTARAALDDAERTVAGAREELRRAKEYLSDSESSLQLKSTERATLQASLEATCAERADLAARVAQCESELAADLQRLGIDAPGVADGMSAAAARVGAFRDAQARLVEAEQRWRALAADRDKAVQERIIRGEAAEQAKRQVEHRQRAVDDGKARAALALGGQDPDVLEAALRKAQKDGEAELQRADTSVATGRDVATRTAATREGCEIRLRERVQVLDERGAELERRLRELGLGHEVDLRRRRLDEAVANALTIQRTRLEGDVLGTRVTRVATEEHVAAHEACRPGDLDPQATPATVAGLSAGFETAQLDANGALNTLDERLRAQDEARKLHGQRLQALEAAKARFDLWKRLSNLIGLNQGDAFQKFAQTLNLAELIDKANVHLKSLEPRYTLVPAVGPNGEARLAFSIRDDYQGGEVRPLKTLSGGETFLVSLSLALGLADYRTLRMPIETLLLDEGFGTLDGDTLQVARAALEALHSRGTQVGIISHVEALKEAIPDCIVVEKGANGRSRIRVESGFADGGAA